jgi:cysteine-rich repeat protein
MQKVIFAAGATVVAVLVACTPETPDLGLGTDPVLDSGRSQHQDGGIRILSDVAPPWERDGSKGRGGSGGGPRDGASTGVDDSDAPRAHDAGRDIATARDAKDDRGSPVPPDGPFDARSTPSDRAGGNGGGAGEGDARSADGVLDVDGGVVLESCAEVRTCRRTATHTEEECLRFSSIAARAAAEPLLACENSACATPCRTAYGLLDCNDCLLRACPAALVVCARQGGCGDGVVARDTEECDDGNADHRDACTTACTQARCGDGFVQEGREACDDANRIETDACLDSCRPASCGDGRVWVGVEGCDDGNRVGGDGCSATCLLETCGNGIVDPGEDCDEGATNRDDGPCLPTCRANRCGDGKVCGGDGCGNELGTLLEECDDGNLANNDGCVTACRNARCGDGHVRDGTETCDDGNDDAFDACGGCATAAGHPLLTEVVTRPAGAEMIEIYNPTRFAVSLSDYFISDSHLYYEAASGSFSTASGSDFAARFPDQATLAPKQYVVVAMGNASGGLQSFLAAYGRAPDFELRPTANQAEDDPAVPNMVAVGGASIGGSASLTDAGEPIVLFTFRGGDLVSDVDYVFYGAPSSSNQMVDKTNVVAGGSSYLADTPAAAQRAAAAPGEAGSLHRCVYAESQETAAQGNGIAGHDETSEDGFAAFRVATTDAERTPGGPPPAHLCSK